MTFNEAVIVAGAYDDELRATDTRFKRSVLLMHEDGSIFHIDSAFLMQKDEFVFMFSEHHSYMVFDKSDLLSFVELKKNLDPIEKLL
jgi:hypothetical protein